MSEQQRLNEIRLRRSRITGSKSGWRVEPRAGSKGTAAIYLGELDMDGFDHHKEENADFIVHAPADIDFLLSLIDRKED